MAPLLGGRAGPSTLLVDLHCFKPADELLVSRDDIETLWAQTMARAQGANTYFCHFL